MGRDIEFVKRSIRLVKNVNSKIIVIWGAGVSSGRDVIKLISLGVEGPGASKSIFETQEHINILAEMIHALQNEWETQKELNISF